MIIELAHDAHEWRDTDNQNAESVSIPTPWGASMSDQTTTRAVDQLTNYNDRASMGSRLRARRSGPLQALIKHAYASHGHVRLLDVGGRKNYWNILPEGFLQQHRVTVTVLNLPGEVQDADDETFRHVVGDATDLSQYPDRSFHIAHSNSVIEHVGPWRTAQRFASECRRVAAGLFVQTPYFWFPVEPHYMMPLFHWCPRPIQELMVLKLPLGYGGKKEPNLEAAIQSIEAAPRLLDLRSFRLLFPDCTIIKERFFLLTKSLIAYRPLA